MTRQEPMLMQSPLSKRVYVVTSYVDEGDGLFTAREKHDVTEQFDALAAMRRGECELTYGETDDGADSWFTGCGGRFAATFEDGRMSHPKFCQLCGRKAVKR